MTPEQRERLRAIANDVMGVTRIHDTTSRLGVYYAATGPADVLALLDALDAAEGERDAYRERLRDVVMIDAEEWALSGGGPGINARREQAWTRAREPFEP